MPPLKWSLMMIDDDGDDGDDDDDDDDDRLDGDSDNGDVVSSSYT